MPKQVDELRIGVDQHAADAIAIEDGERVIQTDDFQIVEEHTAMLTELKKGDEVVTQGGIIGKISGLADTEVTLQVQEGVRIRITRASIQGRYGAAAAAKPDKSDKPDKTASAS